MQARKGASSPPACPSYVKCRSGYCEGRRDTFDASAPVVRQPRRPAMSTNQPDIDRFQRAVETSLREHWVVFLIEGIILVILGAAAIVIPPLATLSVTIFLGWLFLISGIVGLVTTVRARQLPGFWWSLLSAWVAILAGLALIARPASGAARRL